MSNSPQSESNTMVLDNESNPSNNAPDLSSEHLVQEVAEAADDKKAADIVFLKVAGISYLADYFVLATGFSSTQVRAICDSIEEHLETNYQRLPLRVQGKADGRWIVIDYGDVLVHVFMEEEREFYNLEAFWGHAERVEYTPSSVVDQ